MNITKSISKSYEEPTCFGDTCGELKNQMQPVHSKGPFKPYVLKKIVLLWGIHFAKNFKY